MDGGRVGEDDEGVVDGLRDFGESVLEWDVSEEGRFLWVEEEVVVFGEIVDWWVGEDGRKVRNGKEVVWKGREVVDYFKEGSGFRWGRRRCK